MLRIILSFALLALPTVSLAQSWMFGLGGNGRISNHAGGDCWFQQTVERNNTHFYSEEFKQLTGANFLRLTIDEPGCLSISNAEDLYHVNNRISTMYLGKAFVRDMRFDYWRTYSRNSYQGVGECIKSTNYSGRGIWVEYVLDGESIVEVRHTEAMGACGTGVRRGTP